MDFKEFRNIYQLIETTSLSGLKRDLINSAIRYSRIRVDWKMATIKDRKVLEDSRRVAHDVFIDACNILARNMGKKDENNSWRNTLGDDRKVIGDLACYIHLFLGLSAR